mmetsp:Transcript_9963/g.24012  ORF Transcript_9963/g.24012 Transcript_9963/m.24012 type:complete len:108 (+) Transcript_9963:149-472(+)
MKELRAGGRFEVMGAAHAAALRLAAAAGCSSDARVLRVRLLGVRSAHACSECVCGVACVLGVRLFSVRVASKQLLVNATKYRSLPCRARVAAFARDAPPATLQQRVG